MTEPATELHDGNQLPRLGFGVFLISKADAPRIVSDALEAGYRHIDAATAYENEVEVGQAIRASGLDRDEVFVTTKLHNKCHGYDAARRACHESVEQLDVGPIDLYLIHWPVPMLDLYVETWQALIDLQREGVVRSIGVSNFLPAHLDRVIAETDVVPVVNQIELHPALPQAELRELHARLGIATVAWSPLGRGQELTSSAITRIAAACGKTPAQVLIRWSLQLGNVVLVKSSTRERMEANRAVFDFELDGDAMEEVARLDTGVRMGPDPATAYLPPEDDGFAGAGA